MYIYIEEGCFVFFFGVPGRLVGVEMRRERERERLFEDYDDDTTRVAKKNNNETTRRRKMDPPLVCVRALPFLHKTTITKSIDNKCSAADDEKGLLNDDDHEQKERERERERFLFRRGDVEALSHNKTTKKRSKKVYIYIYLYKYIYLYIM